MFWLIQVVPSVSAPTRLRLPAQGTLTDLSGVPLDASKEYRASEGYYLPPAEVPPEGLTVKVGCSVLSPVTNRWESSPDYEIKVVKRTTPMDFYIGHYPGYPAEAVARPGEEVWFGVSYSPYPASRPTPVPELLPPAGYSGAIGSARMEAPSDGSWRCVYKAPDQVPAPMDVKIRFTAEDPWVPQQHEIFFTVHLQP